jgi:predicted glutamine amidotransferase
VLIVSEPLTELALWQKIENNHLLAVDEDMRVTMTPIPATS